MIEEDELKDFVKENLEKINAKLDIKLDVITNKTTLMEICQLLRYVNNYFFYLFYAAILNCKEIVRFIQKNEMSEMFYIVNSIYSNFFFLILVGIFCIIGITPNML